MKIFYRRRWKKQIGPAMILCSRINSHSVLSTLMISVIFKNFNHPSFRPVSSEGYMYLKMAKKETILINNALSPAFIKAA